MLLLVIAVVLGLIAGRLRAPLGVHSHRVRFRHLWLLGVGAAANLAAYLLNDDAATLTMAASLAALLAFVATNHHLTGVVVIGVGLLLNLVALVLNSGMPVRGSALVAAGVVEESELATIGVSGPRHLETSSDPLPVLGDAIPVGLPIAPEVVSFGDLIVVLGAGDAVRELARRRRRGWSHAERSAYLASIGAPARAATEPTASTSHHLDLTTPSVVDGEDHRPPLQRRPRPLVAVSGPE